MGWGVALGEDTPKNEVIKMLEEIGTPENVPTFVADVKAKKARWDMGLGVREAFPNELCMSYSNVSTWVPCRFFNTLHQKFRVQMSN